MGVDPKTIRKWQKNGWTRKDNPARPARGTPQGLAHAAQHIETKAIAVGVADMIGPRSEAYAKELAEMPIDELLRQAGRQVLEGIALFMVEATERRAELIVFSLKDTGQFLAACAMGLAAAQKAVQRISPQASLPGPTDLGPDDRLGAILAEFSVIAERAVP